MFGAIARWVVYAFGASMGGLIFRALAALGIGYATYNFAMPTFIAQMQGYFSALPPEVGQIMALAKVDVACTIIFSAVSVRMASRAFFRRTA